MSFNYSEVKVLLDNGVACYRTSKKANFWEEHWIGNNALSLDCWKSIKKEHLGKVGKIMNKLYSQKT